MYTVAHVTGTLLWFVPTHNVIANAKSFAFAEITVASVMFTKYSISSHCLHQYQVRISAIGSVC